MNSAPIFTLSQVCYQAANGDCLLDDISLAVYPGEIVTIAGPNGAGKTTLLKLMSGQLPVSAGEIYFLSALLSRYTLQELARTIAVISQTEQPDPRLTVREYVSLGGIPHEQRGRRQGRKAEVDEAIALFSLEKLAEKRLDAISGGERQRTFIARSICQRPEVLFLDEPTNHLDPKAKGEILSILSGLDITVVAVLHELPLAARFSDKIILLKEAKTCAFGPPATALHPAVVQDVFGVDIFHFKHPEEERLITCLDIPITQKKHRLGVS